MQGVRQARAEQVAPFSDALLAGPQVFGLWRRVQPDRYAEDARKETSSHRHTTVLLRNPGQRVASRRCPAPGPAAKADQTQTGKASHRRPLIPAATTTKLWAPVAYCMYKLHLYRSLEGRFWLDK